MKNYIKKFLYNNKRKEKILLTLSAILIFLISLVYISKNNTIGVVPDELGYWNLSAMLNGYDWSEVTSLGSYYGYGYGILLIPFMFFFNENTVFMYHAALVMNALLLSSCVFLVNDIIKRLEYNVSLIYRIYIATIIVSYPANYVFVKTTMCETLVTLLFWIILDLVICRNKEKKIKYEIGLIILSLYAYTVHQRCLVILISVILFLIVVNISENFDIKKLTAGLVLTILLILIISIIKTVYQKYLLPYASEDLIEVNNYGGLIYKISSSFSRSGFTELIYSILGKVYYMNIASCLLIFEGITILFQKCKSGLRTLPQRSIIYFYILFCFFMGLFLTIVSMKEGYDIRADFLFYGRYHEYLVGPVLLVALCSLCCEKINIKWYVIIVLMQIILTGAIYKTIPENTSRQNFYMNTSGLGLYYYGIENWKDMIIIANQATISIATLILIVFKTSKKNFTRYAAFSFFLVFWIYSALYTVDHGWKSWKYTQSQENINLVKELIQKETMQELYFIKEKDGDNIKLANIQFLLPDWKVHVISEIKQLEKIDKEYAILTLKNSQHKDWLINEYQRIKENEVFILWKKL